MDIYFEFISNHSLLFAALLLVIVLLLQTIFSDATRKYKLISPPEAVRLINREEAVVIDTRNKAEFKDGHISDAILIPLPEIKDSIEKLNKHEGRPLLFYCKSGTRSDEACKTLGKLGLSNVYALSGGIQAWKDAGMPLVKK
ncbi:MAG: rhodanese-like domain-containing protein [Cycloclasticus sp.]|jgi:rhodanese-related sulfurtransferase|nr:MAG: sulfurtransferase [Cycloclasticus sp. Phe_18]MBV1912555.1 rhodanese-like domain-containing protein [Cycloclasticus sp.]MDF1688465.1 rhodanese-like domain-containing protein [Cycloclasticus sp.]MEE4291626.1 rhodanese-like domain-containing protein [Cycloclasticus sp.]